ncbi:MAG: hypothetical protein WAL63_10460 [Solirubrobacteraceae bacterium]
MSASAPLFSFVQVEFPWPLGPPDGRYLVRPPDEPDAAASHVIVCATLGAPERRRLSSRRRPSRSAPPPAAVATGRATIIDVGRPLTGEQPARAWLNAAGEDELADGLAVLNRALHTFRLVAADPDVHPVARRQAIAARIGFGAGEQVADGLWTAACELSAPLGRRRRSRLLAPQARIAAVLGGREPLLVCEALAVQARSDLDHGRSRAAALQVMIALDAAIAELSADPRAPVLTERLTDLHGRRESVAGAAQAALTGPLADGDAELVTVALARVEAALRARVAADG